MIKKKIINLLSTDGSLQQKTIKSGFWSFASKLSTRGLDLVKLVIVARLLNPNDFGLLGIALLTMAIFKVFTQTGFKESIIQNKNDVQEYLNTAWTTLMLRGILLYAIVFFSSPFIAVFFGEPRAELIIQIMGLTLILEALQNIAIVLLRKELEFQKRFILDLGNTLPSFILTVSLAFILGNVWALVYGTLIGGVGMLFISYLVHPYRPHLEFNKEKAKEMFRFGKWILGSSVIIFFLTQGDDIFVGRILGLTALGFYLMAYKIANLTAIEFSHTIIKVIFPSFSKLQTDKKGLKEAFSKVMLVSAFIIFPMAGLIFLLIGNFTFTVLTSKWSPIIPLVMILVFQAANRAIRAPIGSLLQGIGRPDIETKVAFLQLLILAVLIYPATLKFGIIGVAGAVAFQSLITTLPLLKFAISRINMSFKEWISYLSFPLTATGIMILLVYPIQYYFNYSWISLIAEGFIGLIIYLSLYYLCLKFKLLQVHKLHRQLKIIKELMDG